MMIMMVHCIWKEIIFYDNDHLDVDNDENIIKMITKIIMIMKAKYISSKMRYCDNDHLVNDKNENRDISEWIIMKMITNNDKDNDN